MSSPYFGRFEDHRIIADTVSFVGSELDWLSCDPILPSGDDHPYPMNVEENYVGRLVAKLLLSFDRPGYIFASA